MLRSMYAGVSGMKAHMDKMDVVSNNIANVNTVGYKGSRATFKTMFSQMIQGASAPQGGRGGTNPQQIGLGSTLGSIDKDMGQGSLQSTGRNQDLAVEGNGFFVVSDGVNQMYTKSGSLAKDKNGYLVNSSTGYRVKGWQADANGNIDTNAELDNLTLKQSMEAQATDEVTFSGNLDADAASGDDWQTTFDAYDSQGSKHTVSVEFVKDNDADGDGTTTANQWGYKITDVSGTGSFDINGGSTYDDGSGPAPGGSVTFNTNGNLTSVNGNSVDANGNGIISTSEKENFTSHPTLNFTPSGGAANASVTVDFLDMSQNAREMSASRDTVNGYAAGSLIDYSFDNTGTIVGEYDNGQRQTIGRIALATFNNPGGLAAEGETMFRTSNNSGEPKIGAPANGGFGGIKAGSLEMSNVDLSRQFSEMITTQRGFQANSKTISTSDQILQELVNLKR